MKPGKYFDYLKHKLDIIALKNGNYVLIVCPKCNPKALVLPKLEIRVKCVFKNALLVREGDIE